MGYIEVQKCYLCGSTENLERDHVIPKGLFPKPRPQLLTLPCCGKCNRGLSLDDEGFRAFVSTVTGRSPAGEKIFRENVLKSTCRRSPAFRAQLAKDARLLRLRVPGPPVIVPTFSYPEDRANRTLTRITKGLLTRFYPQYDFSKDVFRCLCPGPTPNHKTGIESLLGLTDVYFKLGDGVFEVRWAVNPNAPCGLWLYRFYGAAVFVCIHGVDSPTELAP